MPINIEELMSLLAQLSEDKNIQVTIKESFKGAALTGVVAFLGGIAFGPAGLALGGLVGGSAAAWNSQGNFRPLANVILEDMSYSQQALLAARVNNILNDLSITDLAILMPLLRNQPQLTDTLVDAVKTFVTSEMNYRLK